MIHCLLRRLARLCAFSAGSPADKRPQPVRAPRETSRCSRQLWAGVVWCDRAPMGIPIHGGPDGGVHWGPVLYREGDYLGTTVNVAARLADAATRHQVLATEAVRREVGDLPGVTFIPLGARLLNGLTAEVGLFEAVAPTVEELPERSQDPVCGMELQPQEVVARLWIDGTQRSFCSDECLRRFVVPPAVCCSPGEICDSPPHNLSCDRSRSRA
jgi:YHS domain-containing protein